MTNVGGRRELGVKEARVAVWSKKLIGTDAGGTYSRDSTLALLPFSDKSSAEAIAFEHQGQLSYLKQSKEWHVWNGRYHEEANNGELEKLVDLWADVVNAALAHAEAAEVNEAVANGLTPAAGRNEYEVAFTNVRRYRDRLFNNAGQVALLDQLKRVCLVDEAAFDQETRWLVVENGVIDIEHTFETGEVQLLPHDPLRLVTKCMNVHWNPAASHEAWERYLASSLPDREVREYLQEWAGSALLGRPKNKGIVNLIGPTNSGKSVFVDLLTDVVGSYGKSVQASTFLAKRDGSVPNELHELRGVRYAGASEPGRGKTMDDALVKQLTGDDMIQSRKLHANLVSWRPQCTIFIATNQPMRFDTADGALLLRIKPVTFGVSFTTDPAAPPELRQDPELKSKLRLEREGILCWLVDGLRLYRQRGLKVEPKGVTDARYRMVVDIDSAMEWVEECVDDKLLVPASEVGYEVDEGHRLTIKKGHEAYLRWMEANGDRRPLTKQAWTGRLVERYGPKKKTKENWALLGLIPLSPYLMTDGQATRVGRAQDT